MSTSEPVPVLRLKIPQRYRMMPTMMMYRIKTKKQIIMETPNVACRVMANLSGLEVSRDVLAL